MLGLLLAYDVIMVPYEAMVLSGTVVLEAAELMAAVLWTLDIVANFVTAQRSDTLVTDFGGIVFLYMQEAGFCSTSLWLAWIG